MTLLLLGSSWVRGVSRGIAVSISKTPGAVGAGIVETDSSSAVLLLNLVTLSEWTAYAGRVETWTAAATILKYQAAGSFSYDTREVVGTAMHVDDRVPIESRSLGKRNGTVGSVVKEAHPSARWLLRSRTEVQLPVPGFQHVKAPL